MNKIFCVFKEASPVVAMAASVAGAAVKRNNPAKVVGITLAAKAFLELIDDGTDQQSLNILFKKSVDELLSQVKDPLVQAPIHVALNKINFDNTSVNVPNIDVDLLQSCVSGFLEGLTTEDATAGTN